MLGAHPRRIDLQTGDRLLGLGVGRQGAQMIDGGLKLLEKVLVPLQELMVTRGDEAANRALLLDQADLGRAGLAQYGSTGIDLLRGFGDSAEPAIDNSAHDHDNGHDQYKRQNEFIGDFEIVHKELQGKHCDSEGAES